MKLLFLASLICLASNAAELVSPSPVLAELFTSEGCSSCPPADALLMKLDKAQPVAGANIIVLSEHVDYWNYLGWSDRFSSGQFSQRQEMYTHFLTAESYTPQLVVDGRKEVLGSDEKAVEAAIAKAATRPKVAVKILSAKRDDNQAVVEFAVGTPSGKADVWVAIADDQDQTIVRNGENKGRTLNHTAVVRSLGKVGAVTKSAGLEKTVRVPLPAQMAEGRVVVIVSEAGGPVLGSAMQELR